MWTRINATAGDSGLDEVRNPQTGMERAAQVQVQVQAQARRSLGAGERRKNGRRPTFPRNSGIGYAATLAHEGWPPPYCFRPP